MRNLLILFLLLVGFNSTAQNKPAGAKKIIFKCFDGRSPMGDWRKQYAAQYEPCDWNRWVFETIKDKGIMHRNGGYPGCPPIGNNQHVVRHDKTIDASKPYTIECDFLIDTAFVSEINSFCVNFNVQRGMSEDDKLNCWSINLDIHNQQTGAYSIKQMGFADLKDEKTGTIRYGWFLEIAPAHTGTGAKTTPGINHFKIEVNRRLDGTPAQKWVTVTWSDATGMHEHFELDYNGYMFEPDMAKPVRVGLNTHGISWTVKNMVVYY